MPEADVLRYSFEASVLTAPRRLTSAMAPAPDPLNSMMTIRTSREIHECVMELWREHPNTLKADILRALLERIIPIALDRGMAAVLKIREKRLRRIN